MKKRLKTAVGRSGNRADMVANIRRAANRVCQRARHIDKDGEFWSDDLRGLAAHTYANATYLMAVAADLMEVVGHD